MIPSTLHPLTSIRQEEVEYSLVRTEAGPRLAVLAPHAWPGLADFEGQAGEQGDGRQPRPLSHRRTRSPARRTRRQGRGRGTPSSAAWPRSIARQIRAQIPGVSLTITGSTVGVDLAGLAMDDTVHLAGHVPDVRPLIAGASAGAAMLRNPRRESAIDMRTFLRL